jgi:uncharacterized membrane protein YphA (DoxX/SURF4 family)
MEATSQQHNKSLSIILWVFRIAVGVLFILSGYSKLIDPHGLEYKMDEFCEVLGWHFLRPHALILSVCMIGFEIIAGFALLIGYRFKLFSILLLLLSLFFTFLTAYALFSGKVKECGCFGNCVKLTNTETFWKDVALTLVILFIVWKQKYIKPIFNDMIGSVLMLVVAIIAFGSQFWVLKHGPLVDCLPYKVGNHIPTLMQEQPGCVRDSFTYNFIYKKGNEVKNYSMDQLTSLDSTWIFVDRKDSLVRKGDCEKQIKDFAIVSFDGTDITQDILTNTNTVVLYFVKDIDKADGENISQLQGLTNECIKNNIPVYGLSPGGDVACNAFKLKHKLPFDFNVIDGTMCKSIIRANSGMVILRNGKIMHKCTSADFPSASFIKSIK